MSDFKFVPQIGMKTNDCYLHGINSNDNICNEGVIEFVGKDYFILRDLAKDKAYIVRNSSYWVIEKGNFF